MIDRIYKKIQAYFNYYLKLYKYNELAYVDTFLINYPKVDEADLQSAPEIIYVFWTGNNELTPNRKKGLESLQKNAGVEVKLITPDNLQDYILENAPLHKAFPYLSLVHKADYLRVYFMYYYGGGYSDIKINNKSWVKAFKKLNISNKWGLGYQELGKWGVAKVGGKLQKDLKSNYLYLIGNGAFIYKPKSPIVYEWLQEVHKRLDYFYLLLKDKPAADAYGKNPQYPLPWAHILGEIHHPLLLKYHDMILKDNSVLPLMENYR